MTETDVLEWNGQMMTERKAMLLPQRTFDFLQGMARRPKVFVSLQKAGYTKEEHAEGQRLLSHVLALQLPNDVPSMSPAYQAALLGIDNWDEDAFGLIRAALERRYPSTYAYLFHQDLKAEQGAKAFISVEKLLDRVELLEKGEEPVREKHREGDTKAIALLFQRGILSEQIIAQLREWIKISKDAPDITNALVGEEKQGKYLEALFALEIWFEDWAKTAKTKLRKRRSFLISLGLAERIPRKKDEKPSVPS